MRLLIGGALALASLAAIADNTADVVAFAKLNRDKFDSELAPVNRITTGSKVLVKGRIFMSDLTYNDKKQEATLDTFYLDVSTIHRDCVKAGEFQGQNPFGVKARVKDWICQKVQIKDMRSFGPRSFNKRIPMTPAQFREMEKGINLDGEIEFAIKTPPKGRAVEYREEITEATLKNPEQRFEMVYSVNGLIQTARVFLPGAKEAFSLIPAGKK